MESISDKPESDSRPAEVPDEQGSDEEDSDQADREEGEVPGEEDVKRAPLGAAPKQQDKVTYDYNADLYAPETSGDAEHPGGDYPGVYAVQIDPTYTSAKEAPTIGMPSIADPNLDKPTMESPAIIQGAALGYEEKTGSVDYTTIIMHLQMRLAARRDPIVSKTCWGRKGKILRHPMWTCSCSPQQSWRRVQTPVKQTSLTAISRSISIWTM